MMKIRILFGVVGLLFGSFVIADADVAVGDSRESVEASLGEPAGVVVMNDVEAFSFERGRVLFRGGRVISHTLVSDEEAEEQREAAERQREERVSEGEALRDEKLADEQFAESPARDRLAFWEVFRQKYPEVDAGVEHAVAARQVEMEKQEAIRDLELRLIEAKEMAEVERQYPPRHAPSYYGSGFPLVFTDPLRSKMGVKHGIERRFGARQLSGPRATARERYMPLQDVGRFPALHAPAPESHPHSPFHHPHHQSPRGD